MRSVRARLSALTLAVIGLLLLPFLFLTYSKVIEEVGELSDARLAQSARTLKRLVGELSANSPSTTIEIATWAKSATRDANEDVGHPYETEIGFQFWSPEAKLRLATSDLRGLPLNAAPIGYADIVFDARSWRVFTMKDGTGTITRAAERYDSREEIEHDLLLQDTAPFLILIPLLGILVRWAIGRELRPIQQASDVLKSRSLEDLSPVEATDPPAEIAPLIDALNATLAKIRGVLENERQFTSNAAHELRTPLAGLTVQLTNAAAASDEPARLEAIAEAHRGVDRMARIVNQMLDLARWDTTIQRRKFANVNIEACVDEELGVLSPIIVERDLEIVRSFHPSGLTCVGWESGVKTIIKNLLENASRYSDENGTIHIEGYLEEARPVFAISDTGPGIPPSVREVMLQRFARGENARSSGSGLGLSIVARVADVHGAVLVMTDAKHGRGLRVEVHFPR
jgi:two-component system sensor histidine kinase QseC